MPFFPFLWPGRDMACLPFLAGRRPQKSNVCLFAFLGEEDKEEKGEFVNYLNIKK
jgi:hypothetical protein